jgi:IclR family transcriptional regulator, pca regulon regulatory protein
VIAALNVSTSARRCSLESVRADLLPPLLAAAREIELDLHRTA